jgi:hypothetical protein
MDAPTTQVTVDRGAAEVMLGAVRASKVIAAEFPNLFGQGDLLRLASAELLLVAALDRISYLESKPDNVKPVLRTKLAAHLAFPAGVKAW